MTVSELYRILNEKIPPSLSCDWDNDGVMCCPEPDREVRRVLVTLDVTADAVRAAIDGGCDLIVSHHPLLFRGIKHLSTDDPVAARSIELCRAGISAFSFHTRLDALDGGVNDALAALFQLQDVVPFGTGSVPIGRIGNLPAPLTLDIFCQLVTFALNVPALLVADAGRTVSRVAVLGGEGGDEIESARAAGADTFLSGRLGYHAMTDAPESGMNLIEAGHFYTEQPVCVTLARMISDALPGVTIVPFYSNRIRTVVRKNHF